MDGWTDISCERLCSADPARAAAGMTTRTIIIYGHDNDHMQRVQSDDESVHHPASKTTTARPPARRRNKRHASAPQHGRQEEETQQKEKQETGRVFA
ncbi:unnamed protein product [Vitrella brassicaformis CCMP3155]|uniref:Uncharacterized protein n=1 Tax=Vitrella brassicaformis (strain CCMP3155) TaxID=1169540 RepID=A0A0G4GU75_VITBC|nr:unnamed protein product [Vitrella brassicaformis CCMP3155]|eukprot:CEM34295.1 unnamed protein product [Vitrella brassicaformis CCMP3155]